MWKHKPSSNETNEDKRVYLSQTRSRINMISYALALWTGWSLFASVVSSEEAGDSIHRSLGIQSYDAKKYEHIQKRRIDAKTPGTSLKRFHPESVQAMLDFRNEECQWQPVQDQFGPWQSIKKHIEHKQCTLQECFLPVDLHEGEGYLHIHRIGPKVFVGDINDKLGCHYVTHMGPVGSYMKAYFAVPVDMKTMETLSFPPVHIHHIATNLGDSTEYMNYASQNPTRSLGNPFLDFESSHQLGGVPISTADSQCYDENDLSGGMGCLYSSVADGMGWKVSKNRGPMVTQVYVEDVRKMDSPPLETAVDFFTVWLTKPKPTAEVKSVIPASFGIWGSYSIGEGRTLMLPAGQDSISMSSFTVPWKANFTNYYYHMHSVDGDEAWLVKGNLGKALRVGDIDASFVHVSSDSGYGDWNPAYSKPVQELAQKIGLGQDMTMAKLKSLWKRQIATAAAASPSSSSSSPVAPVSLLCRYTANSVTVSDTDKPRLSSMYAEGVATGKYSQASREGWKPGQYYRYNTETGPNCDSFSLEAGEEFSLIQFSVARATEFHQHIILFTFINFEEEPNGTKGWEATPMFSKEEQRKSEQLQQQFQQQRRQQGQGQGQVQGQLHQQGQQRQRQHSHSHQRQHQMSMGQQQQGGGGAATGRSRPTIRGRENR